jgi:S-adenosylmethionine:tRNA ribosyltransferase-isomerase
MKTKLFDYDLPPELIAQEPVEPRHNSRLLYLNRRKAQLKHLKFTDLPNLLNPYDLLVFNDTKVLPARLLGTKAGSGGKVEILLLRDLGDCTWETLVNPGRRVQKGCKIIFYNELEAEVVERKAEGIRTLHFKPEAKFWKVVHHYGNMPLPPYIKTPLQDPNRYQTTYACKLGSAAAPTAGLHFSPEIFKALKAKGIATTFLTLHIGLATFRPVLAENLEEHSMPYEYFVVPPEAAQTIAAAKQSGKRIVAVGTTSVRTLETAFDNQGNLIQAEGWSNLFIYPGYKFKMTDVLLTNFHLPRSTLIMLASAFAGREVLLNAYQEAIKERYRFYSFGDAMLIE